MSTFSRLPRSVAGFLTVLLIAGFALPAVAGTPSGGAGERAEAAGAQQPWWVEWLEVFDLDGDRIDDEAERRARSLIAAGKPTATVPVLVSFIHSLPDKDDLVDLLGATANPYFFKTQPVADLNVPARNLGRLSSVPGLAAVEFDAKVRPMLDVSAPATQANRGSGAHTFYNGQTAEDLGYTGEGTVVAVLDTGVQDVHGAFAGKWIAGAYVGAQIPVDCVNPPDDDGHGTHVASTVLGQIPGDSLFGTAKSAKLVEVKISVGPASLGGIARAFDFVKRYNDAFDAGEPLCGPNDDRIDVATLSFGSTGRGGPNAGTDEPFINALVNSGVAVTIAAGNCGPQSSATCSFSDTDNGISSPANAAGAIAVANFDDRGSVDRRTDVISGSSSRGPNNSSGDNAAGGATDATDLEDRYRKPEIAAPGTNIEAAGVAPLTLDTKSGTSMAAPHVAGISALLLEAGDKVKDQTGGRNLMMSTGNGYSATGEYVPGVYPVRDAIIHSPDYKDAGAEPKWTGPNSAGLPWNNAWGYGQINAFGALCWAWQNVLLPGGATPPDPVSNECTLTAGDPTVTITTPESGATVPSGVVNVSGVADRDATVKELTATLSGPASVANGAAATFAVTSMNAAGPVTCTITAEGSPTRTSESADGCSVNLTWTSDGDFNVTGEATDGSSTDAETLTVKVRTPGGIPEPDGSISGGITIFGANPLLAHNEIVSLATGPVDPAPKFLPGEATTFHSRFTEDEEQAVRVGEDTFTWHVWTAEGELVGTAGCTTSEDADTLAPNGFDCVAPVTLPSELGRYYTTLQLDRDERWSCHNGQPIVEVVDAGVPDCLKAFDVVTDTSAGAGAAPNLESSELLPFMSPALVAGRGTDLALEDALVAQTGLESATAAPASAPSEVPDDPQIGDDTGDVTAAGLPIDHMDVEAAWFDNDASFLYVGLKLTDIPADPTTTSQIAYHVNFKPDWVTDPTVFGVPATNAFRGLRVQGILSPVGFDGLTSVIVSSTHHAELQHLSTSAPPASQSQFGTVADLELISVDPDTDIIWWAVPRDVLGNPASGDTLSGLSADSVPAVRGLVTAGSAYGDSSPATDITYPFVDADVPLSAVAGGPYSGAPNTPISIIGGGTGGKRPYSCGWSGPAGATFGDAEACETTVTFPDEGSYTVELAVTDAQGNQASATAPVEVAVPSGERVEISVDGTDVVGSTLITTDETSPSAEWTVPLDLGSLVGHQTVTARWFDANDELLSQDTVVFDLQEETILDLVVEGKGSRRTITATLTEEDGPAIAGREIVFFAEGTEIGRARTNEDGVATLAPPNDYRGDHFLFEARYAGEENFTGSSATYQT